jgi:hypothetical protein
VLSSDSASVFLLGRLAQEGLTPEVVLRVAPGRWRTPSAGHAFAVSDGRLWLAQPQVLGGPSVACVPLSQVGRVAVRTLRPLLRGSGPDVLTLEIELAGSALRYRALDDADACRAFVERVRSGRPGP